MQKCAKNCNCWPKTPVQDVYNREKQTKTLWNAIQENDELTTLFESILVIASRCNQLMSCRSYKPVSAPSHYRFLQQHVIHSSTIITTANSGNKINLISVPRCIQTGFGIPEGKWCHFPGKLEWSHLSRSHTLPCCFFA